MKNANILPLAVGSFPYDDAKKAVDVILQYFKNIPLWPQLPKVSPEEQMYIQYYEGMPGVYYDKDKEKLFIRRVDDEFIAEMALAFEKIAEADYDYFAISPEKARGFYEFINNSERIKSLNPLWIKGQITGPVSFCLVVTDEDLRPALYEDTYREAISSVLKMKAAWQIKKLKEISPDVIIFIDEPYLVSIGSSMVAYSSDEAAELIGDTVASIKELEALAGVHCCGNTDWSILFRSGCDIINLDAYEYGENFLLYTDSAVDYIKNGGMIAWGIVPTSDAVDNETADSLTEKLLELVLKLENKGLKREEILAQSFVTPACGLGNLSNERAEKILNMVSDISGKLHTK